MQENGKHFPGRKVDKSEEGQSKDFQKTLQLDKSIFGAETMSLAAGKPGMHVTSR